ncbi:MAG: hypothetical protein K8R60_20090 [Burkholderiales bacterium]|nr:hypothetical protein [Burkholderiales bacterium]
MTARPAFQSARLVLAILAAGVVALPAAAQTAPPAVKPAAKAAVKSATPAAAKKPEMIIPDAYPEQVKAAEMVYYGKYECEFNQTVDIEQSPKYSSYVTVKHNKGEWLMKPVLSSTGAIRLEDVRGETLMVQIASKSMLLNTMTARRIVDDCISPKQRELIEAAKAAKAASGAS